MLSKDAQRFLHLCHRTAASALLVCSPPALHSVRLQVASFERNPLACLPNYRNKLMQLLPRLQMLDGQGISGQDRQRAGAALKQEAACMAVMLSNACMVHKLVSEQQQQLPLFCATCQLQ